LPPCSSEPVFLPFLPDFLLSFPSGRFFPFPPSGSFFPLFFGPVRQPQVQSPVEDELAGERACFSSITKGWVTPLTGVLDLVFPPFAAAATPSPIQAPESFLQRIPRVEFFLRSASFYTGGWNGPVQWGRPFLFPSSFFGTPLCFLLGRCHINSHSSPKTLAPKM